MAAVKDLREFMALLEKTGPAQADRDTALIPCSRSVRSPTA